MGQSWTHISFFQPVTDEPNHGNISAIDPASGEIIWQNKCSNSMVGGVLSTAGDLIFTGEGEGRIIALDASTGKQLWQHETPYGVNAPPVSYMAGSKQYIAVAAGGNRLFGYKTGDMIVAYNIDHDSYRHWYSNRVRCDSTIANTTVNPASLALTTDLRSRCYWQP